jgi:hypothetical protein
MAEHDTVPEVETNNSRHCFSAASRTMLNVPSTLVRTMSSVSERVCFTSAAR